MTAALRERLARICLALPGAERTISGSHWTLRARKKVFAYLMDDHHGDGILSLACRVGPGDNNALVAAQPQRFYLPAYIGPRGWVALRLDRGPLDWAEVRELVDESYRLTVGRRNGSRQIP